MKKLFLPAMLLLGITATAQVKVGNNPTTIGTSSLMELENPNKALLLTRVNQVTDVLSPADGMIVYDISSQCIRARQNGAWSACFSQGGGVGAVTGGGLIVNNTYCTGKFISITPCSAVNNITYNDDASTTQGIEYDWSDATNTTLGTGFGASSNTRALIEINGQCWSKTNMSITQAYSANIGGYYNNNINNGPRTADGSQYYDGGPFTNPDEGLLYNWSAAMNTSGTPTERGQGVCPVSWHVPSDCEWMFLENSLGMSTTSQQYDGDTYTAERQRDTHNYPTVGSLISVNFTNAVNSNNSGFTSREAGEIQYTTARGRGTYAYYWTSTASTKTANSGLPYTRLITQGSIPVGSSTYGGAVLFRHDSDNGSDQKFSLRCIKD